MHPALQWLDLGRSFYLHQWDTSGQLKQLLAHCQASYPNARADYWPTRVWRQLIWQPVYLSVAAVHGLGLQVSAIQLEQVIVRDSVTGYRWLQEPQAAADENLALQQTASALAHFTQQLLQLFNRQTRVSAANCRGLVADCIFFALAALQPLLGREPIWLANTGARWCAAAQLQDRRGRPLSQWQLEHSQAGQLLSKSCCKSFLVDEQRYCGNCPLGTARRQAQASIPTPTYTPKTQDQPQG